MNDPCLDTPGYGDGGSLLYYAEALTLLFVQERQLYGYRYRSNFCERIRSMSTPLRNAGQTVPLADSPALCHVIERNIRNMHRLRAKAARERGVQDRLADHITSFSGRMAFVYFHIAGFGVWILINATPFGLRPLDPYPYGLLTMIVSLEAIFLSAFVLISQNRLSAEAERRAELDLHIGLLAESELTRILQMLDEIQQKLGIDNGHDSELADLEQETKPEDVLAEIERLQKNVGR